jgi:cytochrome b subunit of formate dehydrogenase
MATPAPAVRPAAAADKPAQGRYFLRFDLLTRVMHGCLMFTFIGCALTGIPLLVAKQPWAQAFARALGGFQVTMLIHRICAAVMIVVFMGHVLRVFVNTARTGRWLDMVWGPNSMVPNLKDVQDIVGHMRWFLGKGERPRFDRYTYWEKFDYWAVFWGMFIIGGSGLLLWFPFFFSNFLPGWIFNIATLIHGEEALLAVGFIFTIHFFNGHVRPEKFPMDPVIFTGRVSEHEMLDERGNEWDRLVQQGRVGEFETTPPTPGMRTLAYVIGIPAVTLGVVTVVLIVYSFVT